MNLSVLLQLLAVWMVQGYFRCGWTLTVAIIIIIIIINTEQEAVGNYRERLPVVYGPCQSVKSSCLSHRHQMNKNNCSRDTRASDWLTDSHWGPVTPLCLRWSDFFVPPEEFSVNAAIMSTALETTGFIMSLISWLVTGASLVNDYWKISTISGSVIISLRQFENLWHSCAENSAGIAECRDFESMLALPGKTRTSEF